MAINKIVFTETFGVKTPHDEEEALMAHSYAHQNGTSDDTPDTQAPLTLRLA